MLSEKKWFASVNGRERLSPGFDGPAWRGKKPELLNIREIYFLYYNYIITVERRF